jgi:hypothetical protein
MNESLSLLFAETSIADISLDYQEAADASGFPIWAIALFVMVAIGIGAAAWMHRSRTAEILDTPIGLMNELCKAHRIGGKGRRLLQHMAETASLDQPAMLFSGPEHLEACIQRTRDQIDYQSQHASTIGHVRRTLYG